MEHDLLIITDATASMGDYLEALRISLPHIISMSTLTGCFARCGLLAYRDYSNSGLSEWSGWLDLALAAKRDQSPDAEGDPSLDEELYLSDILESVRSLRPYGGGDYPEATKTALAKAFRVMRPDAKTIILLYTDAPPHAVTDTTLNTSQEKLGLQLQYGSLGPTFMDWVSACNELAAGDKRAQVFSILEPRMRLDFVGYYIYLSTMTGGSCVQLDSTKPLDIARFTIDVLLAWMGIERTGIMAQVGSSPLARLLQYKTSDHIKDPTDELDARCGMFFPTKSGGKYSDHTPPFNDNTATTASLTVDALKEYLPKKDVPIANFAKRYSTDDTYRQLVTKHLKRIIRNDVRTITINPVFGSLWRAITSDRSNEASQGLRDCFSVRVGRIEDAEDRARVREWLEASYDHSEEVMAIIESVPEENRFPCVYLDPTLSFISPDATQTDHSNKSITKFTRMELLEIGRSCDPAVLRRLSRILPCFTYIEKAADVPDYIAAAGDEQVPKIPTILASDRFKHQFWQILLHLVVPGTMLPARAAALLAGLSLRLGITPLMDAAGQEMLSFRDQWNGIDTPETWNVACMSILLGADDAYRQRQEEASNPPHHEGEESSKQPTTLLKPEDRKLFEHLITYRILELNLDSRLTARVGWSPLSTTAPIGPLVVCRSCRYPRSVTLMGPGGRCGVCLCEDPEAAKDMGVSKDVTEATPATWVECCVPTCRAQYVVYDVNSLNVRPKCHYCRSGSKEHHETHLVECCKCLNRIIWPEEYRPHSFDKSSFVCVHCTSGETTVQDVETTPRQLSSENGLDWLIRDMEKSRWAPFTGRSLYYTVSIIGEDVFADRFRFFADRNPSLKLNGKPIHNSTELVSVVEHLVARRKTAKSQCSLCLSTLQPAALNPACGRRGCHQRICAGCLAKWYGLNAPGTILNTTALACPFCRRFPSARTLSKYGMGIYAVGNLASAVRDRGSLMYAWCAGCGIAKPYMERACDQPAPGDVANWTCDSCREEQAQRAAVIGDVSAKSQHEGKKVMMAMMKACPGCGTMTEKVGGCGHVKCPVNHCGVDWCYFCGKKFKGGRANADDGGEEGGGILDPDDNVFDHMRVEHGGIYDEEVLDGLWGW